MLKTKMLLEYDDSLDTTRSTELPIVQVIVFPIWANCGVSSFSTHMNILVLSKADEARELLAFHRVTALLRTDRDHEQKLVLTRSSALLPIAASRLRCFGPCQSIHCVWPPFSLLSIVHWSSRVHNEHTIFCVSGAFTGEWDVVFCSALTLHIFSLNSTLLCWSNLLVVRFFLRCFFSILHAQGFRSWGSPFWTMPPDCPFHSRVFSFVPGASWEFHGVSRMSVQSQFSSFP